MSCSNVVRELLNDKTYHIEFNGHLTNHVKHAVIALDGLGAADETIRAYYDNYAKLTPYGYGLEGPRTSQHLITKSNWKEFLGQRSSFSSYCDFFDGEEKRLGMDDVLRTYMPHLLDGWVGAFTHATIHLGWALGAEHRWMAIEGLAYMAFTYVPCHPERAAFTGPVADKTSAIDALQYLTSEWDDKRDAMQDWVDTVLADTESVDIHPELARSGLQYRIARMLSEGHPLIYQIPNTIQDATSRWEQLYYTVTLLYLAKPGDFVLLHLITSLYAMEQIAVHLPGDQQNRVAECFWIGMSGVLFAEKLFPKRSKLETLHETYGSAVDDISSDAWTRDWDTIKARAILEEEEHNPKLVYVLKLLWERTGGRALYRSAAAQFTATPELPPSFETPPTV